MTNTPTIPPTDTPASTWRRTALSLSASQVVAWGVLHYSFAVYLPQMQADLGWSLTTLSGGFATATIVAGLAAPFVGRWTDTRGSRSIMSIGTLIGAVGLSLWAGADHAVVFYGAFVLIGVAMSTTLYAPAFTTVIQHHPNHSRQAIVAITLAGGLASTIFSPLAQVLSQQGSWRTGLATLTVGYCLVALPLNLSLPKGRPTPDQDNPIEPLQTTGTARPPTLWQLAAIFTLSAGVSGTFGVHIVAFLIDSGHTATAAASIAGTAGLGKVTGRAFLATGSRRKPTSLLRGCLIVQAAILFVPLFSSELVGALLMVSVFGATSGALTVLRPILVADLVGSTHFGHRNGEIQLITTMTKATTPVAASVAIGAFDYASTWLALALLPLAAALVATRLGRSRTRSLPAPQRTLPGEVKI